MDITSSFNRISIYEWALILLYLIFFIVQIFYYFFLFSKPYRHAANNSTGNDVIDESEKRTTWDIYNYNSQE